MDIFSMLQNAYLEDEDGAIIGRSLGFTCLNGKMWLKVTMFPPDDDDEEGDDPDDGEKEDCPEEPPKEVPADGEEGRPVLKMIVGGGSHG